MEYLYFTLYTGAALLMGAVLFVSVSHLFAGTTGVDPTRITSYIVTGIGFLGGGVIMREGFNVRGMNTAATLWCTAAVGVLCGLGYPLEALLGTAIVLFVHLALRPVAQWIDMHRKTAANVETGYRMLV